MTDFFYWLALSKINNVGPITAYQCLAQVDNDIQKLFSATDAELQHIGLIPQQIEELRNPPKEEIEKDLAWCEQNRCQIIRFIDPAYPMLLRETTGAPLLLYVQGETSLLSEPQIAIVGSRKPTPLGLKIAHEFAQQLTEAGVTVVSGLALGVDGAAHRGALMHGKTIAIMGTGSQNIYPPQHLQLAEDIKTNGALVTEFSPYTRAQAKHFPLRNRIISGLSLGVLVVEAALRSGSLITARYAVEQNREVFAIPGSINNPFAQGCHQLIRQGAKLVESPTDIIEELGALNAARKTNEINKLSAQPIDIDPHLQPVFKEIGYEVTALDVIIMRSGLTAGKVSSMLLSLELAGFVHAVPGGYVRANKLEGFNV